MGHSSGRSYCSKGVFLIMPSVYVEDKHHGIVMIKKVGPNYGIYPLKEVILTPRATKKNTGFTYRMAPRQNAKFVFEKYTCILLRYKPYEDDDVSSSPNGMLEWVYRWAPHKVYQR
jgi:hypothetical protein